MFNGGAPTVAGTSMFTMKNLHTHEGDMGLGNLWLNGLGIYDLMGGVFMA